MKIRTTNLMLQFLFFVLAFLLCLVTSDVTANPEFSNCGNTRLPPCGRKWEWQATRQWKSHVVKKMCFSGLETELTQIMANGLADVSMLRCFYDTMTFIYASAKSIHLKQCGQGRFKKKKKKFYNTNYNTNEPSTSERVIKLKVFGPSSTNSLPICVFHVYTAVS